ncbi:hypothetical protein RCG19_19635 [Neobacillus sp. OS1-2]|uniref:hypothetical protein n=1 Tax=Neobacillus sp. OS1-2 TaxID=3070680 RepID=UPI0027E16853|nr:hypothetical protein [Neobacillus sp. OS1-2]WML39366.1 hypothetical protein RCG19_19635 [Neobacillus sp. OS1-2]
MAMNLVGQQKLFEVPSSMKTMDEDIVFSVTERHSGKASQPTTTRSSTTSSLIFFTKGARVITGFLLFGKLFLVVK